jgi:hypothetical protein
MLYAVFTRICCSTVTCFPITLLFSLIFNDYSHLYLMFIGPCIIVIVEEWKTSLMSLAILFPFLCAQHVSDINVSIIRSLRLCCWITTSGWSLQHGHHPNPAAPNLQHTTNREQNDRCSNSTAQSQAHDDGYIHVRNMLSTQEGK